MPARAEPRCVWLGAAWAGWVGGRARGLDPWSTDAGSLGRARGLDPWSTDAGSLGRARGLDPWRSRPFSAWPERATIANDRVSNMPRPKKANDTTAQLVARAEKALAHRHFTRAARQKAIERLVLNPDVLEQAEARNAARGRANGKPRAPITRKQKSADQRPPEQTQQAQQPPAELVHVEPERPKPVSTAHQHLLEAHASLIERDATLAREIERLEGLKLERESIARQIEALQRALEVFATGAASGGEG